MSVGKIKEFPFDKDGNLQHYPEPVFTYDKHDLPIRIPPVWMEVKPFTATLLFRGYRRGRSAAYFLWEDESTGIQYPMFLKGLSELLEVAVVTSGYVTGKWEIVKRGMNYGIRKVDENGSARV